MRINDYEMIQSEKRKACKRHIAALRLAGADPVLLEKAFQIGYAAIILHLDAYLALIGFPEVVKIPDFVSEVAK